MSLAVPTRGTSQGAGPSRGPKALDRPVDTRRRLVVRTRAGPCRVGRKPGGLDHDDQRLSLAAGDVPIREGSPARRRVVRGHHPGVRRAGGCRRHRLRRSADAPGLCPGTSASHHRHSPGMAGRERCRRTAVPPAQGAPGEPSLVPGLPDPTCRLPRRRCHCRRPRRAVGRDVRPGLPRRADRARSSCSCRRSPRRSGGAATRCRALSPRCPRFEQRSCWGSHGRSSTFRSTGLAR